MKPTALAATAVGLAVALACGTAAGPAAGQAMTPAPLVFFDIAAPDLSKQAAFYKTIFGWEVGADGRFSIPAVSPLPGNLRVETSGKEPPTERVLYLGVQDITATLAKVVAGGGTVVFPRLAVPGVAVVGMFTDPAGNRMGLVEMDGAKVKIPKAG